MRITILLSLILSLSAQAKFSKFYNKESKRIEKILAKRKKRNLAQSFTITDQYFKENRPELTKLRDEFLAIKSADALYKFINKVDDNYDKYKEPDTKFYALQIASMRPYKSVLWRLDNLFQTYLFDGTIDSSNTTQNVFVESVRQLATANNLLTNFNSRDLSNASYSYFSRPYSFTFEAPKRGFGECSASAYGQPFKTEADYRKFLACEVYPNLLRTEQRLQALIDEIDRDYTILWDNRVLFGNGSFKADDGNDQDRFRKVRYGQLLGSMANLKAAKYGLQVSAAYKVDGLVYLMNTYGKVVADIGVKTKGMRHTEGLSARMRKRIIMGNREGILGKIFGRYSYDPKKFLVIDNSKVGLRTGKEWMGEALESLEGWFEYADLTQKENKANADSDDDDDNQLVFNTNLTRPFFRQSDLTFEDLRKLIYEDSATVRSIATGKTFSVSVRSFYTNPPRDLKVFLPTGFKGNGDQIISANAKVNHVRQVKLKGKTYQYRNYKLGTPEQWNMSVYKPYFDVKSNNDLKEAARILAQSWGGVFLTAPLAGAMF